MPKKPMSRVSSSIPKISQSSPHLPTPLAATAKDSGERKNGRTLDPPSEKPPQHHRIPDQTDRVPQHHLRAQPPPEEAKVARMSQVPVHAPRDEHVSRLLLLLDEVVEVRARVQHRRRPDHLPRRHHHGAEDQPRGVETLWEQCIRVGREEAVVEEGFEEGGAVGDVVGFAVAGEEEGRDGCGGRVREGGGVVFEVVEEGEEGEEEGEAP